MIHSTCSLRTRRQPGLVLAITHIKLLMYQALCHVLVHLVHQIGNIQPVSLIIKEITLNLIGFMILNRQTACLIWEFYPAPLLLSHEGSMTHGRETLALPSAIDLSNNNCSTTTGPPKLVKGAKCNPESHP